MEKFRLSTEIQTVNLAELEVRSKVLKNGGFDGVYLSDIFAKLDKTGERGNVIFEEDGGFAVQRDAKELKEIKKILSDNGLVVNSCHFLQTLQPPGFTPEWIFPIHERLLDMAVQIGTKMITTHLGWMFGAANRAYTGEVGNLLAAKKIRYDSFSEQIVKCFGGKEKMFNESIIIYQNLCKKAAERDVFVTIETLPHPLLTENVQVILDFENLVNGPNLGICIDSGHCHASGRNVANEIRIAGKKMAETHFHDNFGYLGEFWRSDLHNPIGIGTINWMDVIHALHEIDYQGWITFEQRDFETNARNWSLMLECFTKNG